MKGKQLTEEQIMSEYARFRTIGDMRDETELWGGWITIPSGPTARWATWLRMSLRQRRRQQDEYGVSILRLY